MSEAEAITMLRKLDRSWPKQLWLFSNGMNLYLMRKNPDGTKKIAPNGSFDDNAIVESFGIPNDGGDW